MCVFLVAHVSAMFYGWEPLREIASPGSLIFATYINAYMNDSNMLDHGGHDRTHGTTMPEDMTIPLFFCGPDFKPGEIVKR